VAFVFFGIRVKKYIFNFFLKKTEKIDFERKKEIFGANRT